MALRRLQRRFAERKLDTSTVEYFRKELDGVPIIVEGKNDKRPLTILGFDNIHTISGDTLTNIVDRISVKYNTVLILTDFDEEGKTKANNLMRLFNHKGTKILTRFRHEFRRAFGVTKIEDINFLTKEV